MNTGPFNERIGDALIESMRGNGRRKTLAFIRKQGTGASRGLRALFDEMICPEKGLGRPRTDFAAIDAEAGRG